MTAIIDGLTLGCDTKHLQCHSITSRKDVNMKLPNGYGSVYKLKGRRRNPWCARKTVGWKDDPVKMTSYPVYQFVGFYPTKQDALQALADFNNDPFDLHIEQMTLQELYDRWSDEHFPEISHSNVVGTRTSFRVLEPIWDFRLFDLKLDHFQKVMDESGKNSPTLKKTKVTLGLMYDYAVKHEILQQSKRDMIRYIDVSKAGNPHSRKGEAFSRDEVQTVWENWKGNEYLTVVLILIYTGCRIGELLELKKEDVHLDDRWFYVRHSKTEAGIREVPIAEKIVPFMEDWMSKDAPTLICTPEGQPFLYRNYYDSYWTPLMKELHLDHTPHHTRHTCISFLTEAGVDDRIIKKIVGHKGQGVTETVYTHLELPIKLEAINRI